MASSGLGEPPLPRRVMCRYTLPGGVLWDRDFLFLEHGTSYIDAAGKEVGVGVAQSIELPEVGTYAMASDCVLWR